MGDRPVLLVTGGGRGIGAAVARRAGTAGYEVVVNYATSRDAAEAIAAQVGGWAWPADVADEQQVMAMFAEIDRRCGRLDVLVNNAGIAGAYGGIEVVDSAMLQRLYSVNVIGAFVCAREAVRRMRAQGGGAIVNISSKAAALGGPGEWVHYASSKGALDTMTIGLSKELGPDGIRVNAVRPGLIDNDFNLQAAPGRVERLAPTVPLGRPADEDEIAAAVLWLASADASYTTGAIVDVAGGR